MNKRSLFVKVIAIANALVITAAFAGCPGRKNPPMVTIAPPPPIVTIAPYGGNVQHILPSDQTPPPANPDVKNDKRSP